MLHPSELRQPLRSLPFYTAVFTAIASFQPYQKLSRRGSQLATLEKVGGMVVVRVGAGWAMQLHAGIVGGPIGVPLSPFLYLPHHRSGSPSHPLPPCTTQQSVIVRTYLCYLSIHPSASAFDLKLLLILHHTSGIPFTA